MANAFVHKSLPVPAYGAISAIPDDDMVSYLVPDWSPNDFQRLDKYPTMVIVRFRVRVQLTTEQLYKLRIIIN